MRPRRSLLPTAYIPAGKKSVDYESRFRNRRYVLRRFKSFPLGNIFRNIRIKIPRDTRILCIYGFLGNITDSTVKTVFVENVNPQASHERGLDGPFSKIGKQLPLNGIVAIQNILQNYLS